MLVEIIYRNKLKKLCAFSKEVDFTASFDFGFIKFNHLLQTVYLGSEDYYLILSFSVDSVPVIPVFLSPIEKHLCSSLGATSEAIYISYYKIGFQSVLLESWLFKEVHPKAPELVEVVPVPLEVFATSLLPVSVSGTIPVSISSQKNSRIVFVTSGKSLDAQIPADSIYLTENYFSKREYSTNFSTIGQNLLCENKSLVTVPNMMSNSGTNLFYILHLSEGFIFLVQKTAGSVNTGGKLTILEDPVNKKTTFLGCNSSGTNLLRTANIISYCFNNWWTWGFGQNFDEVKSFMLTERTRLAIP